MRILHVTDTGAAVPGGRETHISRFAANSIRLGHENAVATLEELGPSRFEPDVVLLHSRDAWGAAPHIRRRFPSSRLLAWVHDQSFVCAASISWFRKTKQECWLPLGTHCVTNAYTRHCNARRPDRNIGNCLKVKSSLDGMAALYGIIVASEYMKKRLVSGNAPESLIHVLPYFVDDHTSQPLWESRKNRRVLYVGRLNETKGVDVLIEAMGHLPQNVELMIAGDGYVMGDLKTLAAKYDNPRGRITFTGHLTDPEEVERAYRSADVLAVPSLWPEPFGIVGLEGMVNGLPVVASRVGGISEWLRDGQTGYLTHPGNPVDLAEKLQRLLSDDELRHTFGNRAWSDVRSRFSWDNHWNGFVDIVNMSRST